MAVSASDFWQQLVRIGIVDPGTAKVLFQRYGTTIVAKSAAKGDGSGNAAVSVAQFLIANQVVTQFQSQRLLAGRAGELRVGEYLVLDRCDRTPLSRWYRARHLGQTTECFLYPCTDSLTSSRWVDPEWLRLHGAVIRNGLQSIHAVTLVASDPWRGAVVSELPGGKSLDQWFADRASGLADGRQALNHMTAASIGQVVADSLAAMHESNLVHGEVRSSRVWCGDDQSLWLLRDAGRPPISPEESPQEHRWLDDDSSSAQYRAPELDWPHAVPSITSDLFSLGALIFKLATGRNIREFGENYLLPDEVAKARDAGPAGDLLMRTIAYAIDPNPASRFPDVRSFSRALSVVVTAYAAKAPTSPPTQASAPTLVSDSTKVAKFASETVALNDKAVSPISAESRGLPARTPAVVNESKSVPEVAVLNKRLAKKPAPVAKVAETESAQVPSPASPSMSSDVEVSDVEVSAQAAVSAPFPVQIPTTPMVPPSQGHGADAGSRPKRVRKKKHRTRRGPIVVGSVAAVVLIGIVAALLRPSSEETPVPSRPPLPSRATIASMQPRTELAASNTAPGAVTVGDRPNSNPGMTTDNGFELVEDDRLLWASPWSPQSKPPSLEMVPPGSQLLVALRLSRILGVSEGNGWLAWLGTELRPALEQFEARAGLKADRVDRLTIAFAAGSSGHPQAAYTVRLHEPVVLKEITERWGVTPSRTRDGKTIYTDDTPDGDTFYVRENNEKVESFTFGPVDLVTLVAENDGNEIPLARALAQLWETTSADADFVMLAIPNFLFADGRELLSTYAPRASGPLRAMLIPDVAAAMVSMGLIDQWYVETRLSPSGNTSASALLQTFQSKIVSLNQWADAFAVDGNAGVSWRAMAIRLPQFMRAITDQTRFGVADALPMFNFHLPAEAAPQVMLATVLALSAPEIKSAVVEAKPAMPAMPALTAEELLDVNFSVSFDQESLEFAVSMIRDEFTRSVPEGSIPPTITILGGDLEKSGITQNQQIRNFQMREKPLREALSELVRQANPDKTVASLADEKQALVWVIDPTSTTDSPKILITTRPSAEAKQLKLSKEFSVP